MKLKYLNLKHQWNLSYKNLDNLLFYPNENVIKFLNKFISRKTNIKTKKNNKYFLDLGCGAGRHIKYLVENGYKCIGIDLSSVVIEQAKSMLNFHGICKSSYKLINCNSNNIPLKNNSIDYVISDSSVDSMPSEEIVGTINEVYRLIKKKGLFYVNIISKTSKNHQFGKFINKYDFLIKSKHEKNTIQSYFTEKRIKEVFSKFKILHCYIVTERVKNRILNCRYHLILKKH